MSELDEQQVPTTTSAHSKLRSTNSMDMDFHHDDADDKSHPTTMSDDSSSFSSGSDEFGEASVNSEPDKEFMNMMLVESHPDRLNLLEIGTDAEIPQPAGDDGPGEASSASSVDVKSPVNPRVDRLSMLAATKGKKSLMNGLDLGDDDDDDSKEKAAAPAAEASETTEGGEDADAFAMSPTPSKRPPMDRQSLLNTMGKSTKKSFRKISSGGFWSKPFKGLGKGRRKGSLDVDSSEEMKS